MSRAFFDKVLEEVKVLKLSDVIEEYVDVKVNAMSDNDALCPFHGDDKLGNFKINDNRNVFKCFSCAVGGDGIKFFRLMEDMNEKHQFKPAVMMLAFKHGIITKAQADSYINGMETSGDVKRVAKKEPVQTDALVEKAPAYMLDYAFRAFMKFTNLSEAHRVALYERGMNNEEIEKGMYFTFPEASSAFLKEMYESLKADGVSNQLFKHIPGFVTADHLKQEQNGETRYLYTFMNQKGMGIPVMNANNEIVGIQIRKDKADEGHSRYTWFTSTFAENKNAYKHGTTAGAPLHVTYPEENKFKNVAFITEGIFKASAIASKFQATAISLQGVGNFHTIVEELTAVEEQNGKLEHIFIAFDADMAQNVHVYRHLKNLVEKIKEAFPEVALYNSLWDEAHGKGMDDLIQAGEISRLKRVKIEPFIEKYDAIIEALETEHQTDIVKIKKEAIKEAFVQQVFNPLMKTTA